MSFAAAKHQTSQFGIALAARAKDAADARDKPEIEAWFLRDRALFAAMDADHNNFLDKEEFKNLLKKNFDMSGDHADEVFKKYDIDEGGSIGPLEFCQMLAVWNSECKYHFVKHQCDAVHDTVTGAIPCMCCDGICIKTSSWFGCACSLCTLGLSWIPCYCIAAAAASNVSTMDSAFMEKELEKAAKNSEKEAKKTTANRLKKGPTGTLLKASECIKK